MPFRNVENIDDETRHGMMHAFEAACERLKLEEDDPLRAKLAAEIIALVSVGERDPGRLYALALEVVDVEE